jgi:hypothetical protein
MQSLRNRRLRLRAFGYLCFLLFFLSLVSCTSTEKLKPPIALQSPYEHTQLWAVAPFANESGVSIVNSDRIADLFVEQAQQIEGVETVPVNRVLLAMRKLQLRSIATTAEARSLMNALGVEGLIVGTVTVYDPYQPPKLAAAIQLYRRDRPGPSNDIDPIEITRARTETPLMGAVSTNDPVAHAAGVFDAANHQTLMQLDEYATGRSVPDSAFGRRIYLVNMEMYTQFVAYRLLSDLLERERARLNPEATQMTLR